MRSLEVVTRHIIENHPSRTYYPVILLTDNVTEVPHLPPGVCELETAELLRFKRETDALLDQVSTACLLTAPVPLCRSSERHSMSCWETLSPFPNAPAQCLPQPAWWSPVNPSSGGKRGEERGGGRGCQQQHFTHRLPGGCQKCNASTLASAEMCHQCNASTPRAP
eukprot:6555307-Pyramimonas_sp.AAC.1